jgi:hypothetical protein
LEPPDHSGCKGDGPEEGGEFAIVAGGDPSPVIEAAEDALDAVTLSVDGTSWAY